MLVLLLACSQVGQPCQGSAPGHGHIGQDGQCKVLPTWAHGEADPEWGTVVEVSMASPMDWGAINGALAQGPVRVAFAPEVYDQRIDIQRTDTSENRLLLDGGVAGSRATVPGVLTAYEGDPQSHITVRGFEITGSADKGVFWLAGDQVILEDLVIHDNAGTPAINLQYSNRSGHRSERFVVRNSHVYSQRGECIYIGGSEGEDQDSHLQVEVVNNLVHDCVSRLDTRNDGINIKDRIGQVWVHRNVVARTDWGIEVASPGLYNQNLVFDTEREGFQISDAFQAFTGEMRFEDNVVLGAGHDGFHVSTLHATEQLLHFERNSAFASKQAGVLLGGESAHRVALVDLLTVANAVGIDGWGTPDFQTVSCFSAEETSVDRAAAELACDEVAGRVPEELAGEDGLYFTADDPWLQTQGAQLRPTLSR